MMKRRGVLTILLLFVMGVAFAQPVVITPPEAYIEPGGAVTLTASGALYYQWAPATGLSTTEGPVTVASPMVTTTYTCSGYAPGAESVVNSSFEQGNVGFTSAYTYTNNLQPEGTYSVGPDASAFHPDFVGTGHGGSGNFMVVNGATSPGTNVWTEQISVNPNTYYAFSTWVCTVSAAGDVARLQFSINNTQLGDVFLAPDYTNQWLQFYELWYSGNNTSASITILNQNTAGGGNDFGLDDISFCELVLVGDPQCTVYVNNLNAIATADQNEFCEGGSTTLHVQATGGSSNYTYSWTPANTLDNPNSPQPVATPPVGTTTYTCHVSDGNNAVDVRVTLVVQPNSEETLVTEAICHGETFEFYGQFYDASCQVSYTDQNMYGCDSVVTLNLTVYPPNDTTLVDPSICFGQSYNFHGTLYDQDGQIAFFDTIDNHGCLKVEKLVLTVDEYQRPPVLYQYECYAHGTQPSWYWDKTGTTYHEDTYDEIVLDDPNGGCPILHRLDLKFHEEYYHEEDKVACGEYYWPITGETFTESQEGITHTFTHTFGDNACDSTYVLNLTIANYETTDIIVPEEESCDGLLWDPQGRPYTTNDAYDPADHWYTESGTYQRTYKNQMDCDSIVTMYVDFEYTPHPTDIYPMDPLNTAPHWVITATEFQINDYDFYFWDANPNCHWDSVTWDFETPVNWVLEPFGEQNNSCKVYVLSHVDDTVWLNARAYNRCAAEGIMQRYWFVCSFYGVDEIGLSADLSNFDVVPNPNNGLMSLHFEQLTGKVDLKVYDMMGNLIDNIQTYNDMDSFELSYEMKQEANGIYFFVATGKEGTLSKKVIINR